MAYSFRGRFEVKIDSKGRLNLPTAYKKSLLKGSRTFVVTNSLYRTKPCLDVYPIKEWENLETRIQSLPQLKPEVQAYQRFYLSGGHEIGLDGQNRLLLPQTMRTYAQMTDEIMLVGMGKKIELWSSALWSQLFGELVDNYETILAQVADLGGHGG